MTVAVVFDLGQVLAPAWDLRPVAASVGADPDAFAAAYWAYRVEYDCGWAPRAYWDRVLQDCVAGWGGGDDAVLDRLAHEDAVRWVRLAPESEPLLADVRASGAPLALLSNAPHPLADVARAQAWSRHFDVLVFSAEVGVAKPDLAIYDILRDKVGVPAGELVFFDDRPANVEGARAAGWQAHLWAGFDDARQVLAPVLTADRR